MMHSNGNAAIDAANSQKPTPPATAVTEVIIDNFAFTPPTITVPVGATVYWINHDGIPHNIVADKGFKSKVLDTNGAFKYTFSNAGTYL